MKTKLHIEWWIGLCLIAFSTQAQVPPVLKYQSQLFIGGTNYQGVGWFKFALMDAAGKNTHWSNDGSSEAGSEPKKGLPLEVVQGAYEVYLGDTSLTNMVYLSPDVFNAPDLNVRVWFSPNGQAFQKVEPDHRLGSVGYAMMAGNVADGAITSAKIVEGAVTAGKLAPYAVTSAALAPGSIEASKLAPDAAAVNLNASGGLVLSELANATNLTRVGFARIGTVLTDSEQWTQVNPIGPAGRYQPLAVWTGYDLMVYGGFNWRGVSINNGFRCDPRLGQWYPVSSNDAPVYYGSDLTEGLSGNYRKLVSAGSDSIVFLTPPINSRLYSSSENKWRRISQKNFPTSVANAVFVWTESELLVWDGLTAFHRYSPATDTWLVMSKSNAPSSRAGHTGIWTGREMIVWGGNRGQNLMNGGRYDPRTDTWKSTSTLRVPQARSHHSAIWTGEKMVVWGGETLKYPLGSMDGGQYDPIFDSWSAISTNNAPSPRSHQQAFWSGSEMVVWGGSVRTSAVSTAIRPLNDGARYSPAKNTWTPLAQSPLRGHAAVAVAWTGKDMMIWGGKLISPSPVPSRQNQTAPLSSGWTYRMQSDDWSSLPFTPDGRIGHSLVWTGDELLIWGGMLNSPSMNTPIIHNNGARFNPRTGTWKPMSMHDAPSARFNHRAIWTGKEMVVWGGEGYVQRYPSTYSLTTTFNTGGRYNPVTDSWAPISTNGAPAGRSSFSLVWSGKNAILFGGMTKTNDYSRGVQTDTGGLYDPENDAWISMTTSGAPSAREGHLGVWTGTQLLVWGGSNSVSKPVVLNDGAFYDPRFNRWQPVTSKNAPQCKSVPKGVWTRQELIVWSDGSIGGRYSPGDDRWSMMSRVQAPISMANASMVWSGKDALVWGAQTSNLMFGKRYNPMSDTWSNLEASTATQRTKHEAAWTDHEMVIFGGQSMSAILDPPRDTLRYATQVPMYLYRKP